MPMCRVSELRKYIEYGVYDFKNNIIIIFYNTARTPRLICKTIIHEYTHAQQDMSKYVEHMNNTVITTPMKRQHMIER